MNKELILKDNLSFFNKLSSKDIEKLVNKSFIKEYKKGEIVHNKNSTCTGILITLKGQFRSYISSPMGKEITLFKLFERDICALSAACAFSNITYDINLIAQEDSTALLIDSLFIKELSQNNTYVSEFLLNLTQNKLSEVLYVLEQSVFFSLDNRIANFLIEEYNINNSNILYITHELIANHLGSSREVISRILKKFEKENIVEVSRGKIKILDINKLTDISNL